MKSHILQSPQITKNTFFFLFFFLINKVFKTSPDTSLSSEKNAFLQWHQWDLDVLNGDGELLEENEVSSDIYVRSKPAPRDCITH